MSQDETPESKLPPPSVPPQGKAATTAPNKPLKICAIGDIFIERYLWPDRDGDSISNKLPYTAPDELRSCESTNTFVELSGSPLHLKIYQKFLEACGLKVRKKIVAGASTANAVEAAKSVTPVESSGFEASTADDPPPERDMEAGDYPQQSYIQDMSETGKTEIQDSEPKATQEGAVPYDDAIDALLESVPTDEELKTISAGICKDSDLQTEFAKSFSLDSSFGPFPIYLHELQLFDTSESDRSDPPHKTWRISKSLGEIRSPQKRESVETRVKEGLETLKDATSKWLTENATDIREPMVVVLCDRNAVKGNVADSSARKMFGEIVKETKSKRPDIYPNGNEMLVQEGNENLLILWHTRSPLMEGDDELVRFLTRKDILPRTIPIVSDHCLREEGVMLRFDVSYESTIRDFFAALDHRVIQELLRFPHALIRFDYGVVHLTSHKGRPVGMDIHGLASRHLPTVATRRGIVNGMTPLLIGSILREITAPWPGATNHLEAFLEDAEKVEHPTILHNTRLDRAIDVALLLGSMHFTRGYGDDSGDPFCQHNGATEDAFAELVKELVSRAPNLNKDRSKEFKEMLDAATNITADDEQFKHKTADASDLATTYRQLKICNDPESGLSKPDKFVVIDKPADDRVPLESLTRFSVDKQIFDYLHARKNNHEVQKAFDDLIHNRGTELIGTSFSRGESLRNWNIMAGVAGVPYLGVNSPGNVDDVERNRQAVLYRIVERGLDYVLHRPPLTLEKLPGPTNDANSISLARGQVGQSMIAASAGGWAAKKDNRATGGKTLGSKVYRIEPAMACPCVQFGDLATVDPRDIDAFLAIRFLVDKYLLQDDWNGPLALAVFGKPGSGKSTIVRKILDSVHGCDFEPGLSCNLSQWTSVESLTRQFHKIQDRTLHTKKTPVVLIDEFDSPLGEEDVGWLKFFLMPLQDGLYMVGNDTFHIGKCIFVFAGGVTHKFEQFKSRFYNLANAKVPDFVSRLRAYIDVQDISLSETFTPQLPSADDHSAQLRRAGLLRDLLIKRMPNVVDRGTRVADVSRALVYAFMNVRSFEHGVRSMEAIIQTSRVSKRATSYQPSGLPPATQLALHVDEKEFMGLVRKGTDLWRRHEAAK